MRNTTTTLVSIATQVKSLTQGIVLGTVVDGIRHLLADRFFAHAAFSRRFRHPVPAMAVMRWQPEPSCSEVAKRYCGPVGRRRYRANHA